MHTARGASIVRLAVYGQLGIWRKTVDREAVRVRVSCCTVRVAYPRDKLRRTALFVIFTMQRERRSFLTEHTTLCLTAFVDVSIVVL